jgi:hypothetical protein
MTKLPNRFGVREEIGEQRAEFEGFRCICGPFT